MIRLRPVLPAVHAGPASTTDREAGQPALPTLPAMRRAKPGLAERAGESAQTSLARPGRQTGRRRHWTDAYTRTSIAIDLVAALGATLLAILLRFGRDAPTGYLNGSLAFGLVWIGLVAMSRAYEIGSSGSAARRPGGSSSLASP